MGSTNATRLQQHTTTTLPGHNRTRSVYRQFNPQLERQQRHQHGGDVRSDEMLDKRHHHYRHDRKLGGVTTALMYACQQGDVDAVSRIIEEQPLLVSLRDRSGKSALHYSCQSLGRRGAAAHSADLLLMAAPQLLEGRDEDGFTPLHLAVIAGNMQLITFLLANRADVNAVDNENHTVVHWATVCGEIGALRAVLAAGAPVSTPDVHGGYPLHYAAQMCGADKDRELSLSVLQTLLTQPDIDTRVSDGDGRQPLLWAGSAGAAQAVLALVKAGAALEAPDRDGLTALHCAASRGHSDALDTLLTLCGAQVDVIDGNGCTALHYAVTLGHADATALLLAHGANPNRQDRKGRSPAHCACAKGQSETVRMLAGIGGANLWLRNARGDLPLHEAAASGRRSLVRWLLEQRPSYVNARNNDGRCPLHLAALNDNADMCKVLLDNGAQINPLLRTSKNVVMTPLDCALTRGYRTTAKYLQVHGGVSAKRLDVTQISTYQNIRLVEEDGTVNGGDTNTESDAAILGKDTSVTKPAVRNKITVTHERQAKMVAKDELKLDQQKTASAKVDKGNLIEVNLSEEGHSNTTKETKVLIVKEDNLPSKRAKSKHKKQKDLSNRKGNIEKVSTEIEIKKSSSSNDIISNEKTLLLKNIGDPSKSDNLEQNIKTIDNLAHNIEENAKIIQKEVKLINEAQQKIDAQASDNFRETSDVKKFIVEATVHSTPKETNAEILQSVKSLLEREIKETMQQFKVEKKTEDIDNYNKTITTLISELNDVKNEIKTMKKSMESDSNKSNLTTERRKHKKKNNVVEENEDFIDETATSAERVTEDDITLKLKLNENIDENIITKETTDVSEKVSENNVDDCIQSDFLKSTKDVSNTDATDFLSKSINELTEDSKKSDNKKFDSSDNVYVSEKVNLDTSKIENSASGDNKDVNGSKTNIVILNKDEQTDEINKSNLTSSEIQIIHQITELDGSSSKVVITSTTEYDNTLIDPASETSKVDIDPTGTRTEIINDKDISEKADGALSKLISGTTDSAALQLANNKTPSKFIEDAASPNFTKNLSKPEQAIGTQRESSIEPNSTDEESSVLSAATTRERKHKSFTILGETAANTTPKARSRSEEVRLAKRKSKIPTPVASSNLSRTELSKSERNMAGKMAMDSVGISKMPSLPNLTNGVLRPESNMSAPLQRKSNYSDEDRRSVSDLEYDDPTSLLAADSVATTTRRIGSRKRLMKRRSRSRTSRSAASLAGGGGGEEEGAAAHSDYESSNVVDSGFEPSPRSLARTVRPKLVSNRGVNMASVTQSIQTNIRRYHLERKIFQHLLDLKRLQIRSGQHNEHMLIKRAIDSYHRSCAATVGAGRYTSNDYTFKGFEQFLYHSLRKLQLVNNVDYIKDLPAHIAENPLHCTQSTHRCSHATHAYTGIPCAAYLPKLDHHTIPKIGFDTECKPSSGSGGFLPYLSGKSRSKGASTLEEKKGVFLELRHGSDKQVISLPTDRLDQNKRYYVTFTVKGQEEEEAADEEEKETVAVTAMSDAQSHRHAKSV